MTRTNMAQKSAGREENMSIAMIVWIILIVFFSVLEAATVGLVSLWFAVGGLGALTASIFTDNVWIQVSVFVIVSAVALAAMRPLVKKVANKNSATNADRNIGRTADVIAAISPQRPGRVKLDGVDWSATSDVPLAVGTRCIVTAIHGTLLIVQPEEKEKSII